MKTKKIIFLLFIISNITFSGCVPESNDDILINEPRVTTIAITKIDATSATSGGSVINDGGAEIIEQGICWGTNTIPTINDNKTSEDISQTNFASNLSNLQENTTYYVRAYAKNKVGVGYGDIKIFTAVRQGTLHVLTKELISNDLSSLTLGGVITNNSSKSITELGICWSISNTPTLNDNKQTINSDSTNFEITISNLSQNTTYYYRAYAINAYGITYGEILSAKTCQLLSLQPGSEGKDAYIHNNSTTNMGYHVDFNCMAWTSSGNSVFVRSLIDFDFSLIPDNTIIKSAKLSLYNNPNSLNNSGKHSEASVYPTTGGDNGAYLKRITSSWEENLVTWSNQPTTTSTNQVLIPASTNSHQDYIDIDITTLLQDIINNKSTSYGLMLTLKTEVNYRALIFASSDNSDATKHPKLIIEY